MNLGTPTQIRAGATRFQTYLDDLFDRPANDPEDDDQDEPPMPETQLRLFQTAA